MKFLPIPEVPLNCPHFKWKTCTSISLLDDKSDIPIRNLYFITEPIKSSEHEIMVLSIKSSGLRNIVASVAEVAWRKYTGDQAKKNALAWRKWGEDIKNEN